jgi:hypothetical protein
MFEMADFGGAVRETKGLPDVDIFLDGGVLESRVDVLLEEVKILGRGDGEKHAEAGNADDLGEGFSVVNTLFMAETHGNESGFKAGDVSKVVAFDLVDLHVVHDTTTRGDVDKIPCVVGVQGVEVLLHGLTGGVGTATCVREGGRFRTVLSGHERHVGEWRAKAAR